MVGTRIERIDLTHDGLSTGRGGDPPPANPGADERRISFLNVVTMKLELYREAMKLADDLYIEDAILRSKLRNAIAAAIVTAVNDIAGT